MLDGFNFGGIQFLCWQVGPIGDMALLHTWKPLCDHCGTAMQKVKADLYDIRKRDSDPQQVFLFFCPCKDLKPVKSEDHA